MILPIYFYILGTFHSSCQVEFNWEFFFARPTHFTSEFAMTVLSKCVCLFVCLFVCVCVGYDCHSAVHCTVH